MGVEREQRRDQRDHRRPRAVARRGRRVAPRAPCHRDAGDPQQQAEHAGFAQHFQHPLVRVEGRSIAPGRDLARLGIAGREHVAEIARAHAVHRMLADHAQRRAPDARSTGQRDIDAIAVGGQRRGGAFETLAHLRREREQPDREHRAQREHHRELAQAQRAPAGQGQHQRIGDPRGARAGEQDHQPHRERGDQPARDAPAPVRDVEHERRQARQHQAELEVAGAEDAAEPVEPLHFLGGAHAMVADRVLGHVDEREQRARAEGFLQQRIQRPDAHDRREPGEGRAPPGVAGDRGRGQPQERQVAQVGHGLREAVRAIGRVEGREQLRQPVRREQHAGQRPGLVAEQAGAAAEALQQQLRDRDQRAEHQHAFRISRRRPQRDVGQHPRRRPAPAGDGRGFSRGVRRRAQAWPPASHATCRGW